MSDSRNIPGTILLVTDDGMGKAEPQLRHKLIRVYFSMLLENGCCQAQSASMVTA